MEEEQASPLAPAFALTFQEGTSREQALGVCPGSQSPWSLGPFPPLLFCL